MTLFWLVIVFVVSLAVLVKSADFFTEAAERIGEGLGIPSFIIGVTVVAAGTSLPELASSIAAVLRGSSEIVAGNVIGSNIANICLVLGATGVVAGRARLNFDIMRVDVPFLVGSASLLTLTAWDGVFTWREGIIFILALVAYIGYAIGAEEHPPGGDAGESSSSEKPRERHLEAKPLVTLVVSGVAVYFAAHYTVESVVGIADALRIGAELIATTAVALGTSLPELTVSVSAARRGRADLAAGNILGSSIFNTFGIMAIPSFLGPLVVPGSLLTFGLPVMLVSTLLYAYILQDREITRWEGSLLLICYLLFIGKTVGLV